jgi:DNA-binding MarR family transcriptional regulator
MTTAGKGIVPRRRPDTESAAAQPFSPTALIESQLTAADEPVLGLYLHVAYMTVMATFGSMVGRGEVTPAMIGTLALVAQRPGISQAELARIVGLERATVGATVARTIEAGFVRRDDAKHDGRSYALHLTIRGEQTLKDLRKRMAAHEKLIGANLTKDERVLLRDLLNKLVHG